MMASDLPAPPSLASLAESSRIALFLDFDGTLVEIAETPDGISVPSDMPERLRDLSQRFEGRMALVTGRAAEDLAGHCPIDGIACAGSHGAARYAADGSTIGAVPEGLPIEAVASLREMAGVTGIAYEEKAHGGALHYRARPEFEAKVVAHAHAVARNHGLEMKRGKRVVELVRPGANKGSAVRAFLSTPPFAASVPIFVGDDITDEDGFEAVHGLGGFGIIVGDRRPTLAQYALPDILAVRDWLNL